GLRTGVKSIVNPSARCVGGVSGDIGAAIVGKPLDPMGTVLNFVFGLGTMGRKELSHGPTQRTEDP
ncbi:MAG: hypothetical protein WCG47_22850, partial [Dermatophilaceae bacterium]